jgi:hypothetical protein
VALDGPDGEPKQRHRAEQDGDDRKRRTVGHVRLEIRAVMARRALRQG